MFHSRFFVDSFTLQFCPDLPGCRAAGATAHSLACLAGQRRGQWRSAGLCLGLGLGSQGSAGLRWLLQTAVTVLEFDITPYISISP
jgi:hypothetical protein